MGRQELGRTSTESTQWSDVERSDVGGGPGVVEWHDIDGIDAGGGRVVVDVHSTDVVGRCFGHIQRGCRW